MKLGLLLCTPSCGSLRGPRGSGALLQCCWLAAIKVIRLVCSTSLPFGVFWDGELFRKRTGRGAWRLAGSSGVLAGPAAVGSEADVPLIFGGDLTRFSILGEKQDRGLFFSGQGRLPSSLRCICSFQGNHLSRHSLSLQGSGPGQPDALAPG